MNLKIGFDIVLCTDLSVQLLYLSGCQGNEEMTNRGTHSSWGRGCSTPDAKCIYYKKLTEAGLLHTDEQAGMVITHR